MQHGWLYARVQLVMAGDCATCRSPSATLPLGGMGTTHRIQAFYISLEVHRTLLSRSHYVSSSASARRGCRSLEFHIRHRRHAIISMCSCWMRSIGTVSPVFPGTHDSLFNSPRVCRWLAQGPLGGTLISDFYTLKRLMPCSCGCLEVTAAAALLINIAAGWLASLSNGWEADRTTWLS